MATADRIVAGDVVYLNSGSPPLTVASVIGDDLTVTWIDEASMCHVAAFPLACVHK